MAYDSATGNLTRRVDGTHGSTQKMHSTRADLQGNVVVGGFYNELLTGVAYENYDLLRTDMLRCKNVKGFNIYHPVYGTLDTCNTVSASDSDQRSAGELCRIRAGRAVPDRQLDRRRRRALPVLHPVRR